MTGRSPIASHGAHVLEADWFNRAVDVAARARTSSVAEMRSLPNLTWETNSEPVRQLCRDVVRPILLALVEAGFLAPPSSEELASTDSRELASGGDLR